jgi:hypothetical protein
LARAASFVDYNKLDSISQSDLKSNSVTHVIILPNYKEDLGTIHETLRVLASHRTAKKQYCVCLAMEETEQNHTQKVN